jgi:hypothetical protein
MMKMAINQSLMGQVFIVGQGPDGEATLTPTQSLRVLTMAHAALCVCGGYMEPLRQGAAVEVNPLLLAGPGGAGAPPASANVPEHHCTTMQ